MKTSTLLLEDATIRKLKHHFAPRFPHMSPLHRTELAARGLGYRTYASLLAALREGPHFLDSIDAERAVELARQIGFKMDPHDVRQALVELFELGSGEQPTIAVRSGVLITLLEEMIFEPLQMNDPAFQVARTTSCAWPMPSTRTRRKSRSGSGSGPRRIPARDTASAARER